MDNVSLGIAVLACMLLQVTGNCDDVHDHGCALLATNRNICADSYLANNICPRFCNKCPLTCYACNSDFGDTRNCNITKTCASNETCMLKTLRSTADGHVDYEMGCDDKAFCDGTQGVFIGKREDGESRTSRDISIQCCSTDRCNLPGKQIPTMTVPVTMPVPSAGPQVCAKDIEFLIDDSSSVTRTEFDQSMHFVNALINHLQIGTTASMVGLATFDTQVHKQWDLDDYTTQQALQGAQSHVKRQGGGTNLDAAVRFALVHALKHRYGDRPNYPDVVVLLTDGKSDVVSNTLKDSVILHSLSKDVIAIGVGNQTSHKELTGIATNRGHVITVNGYNGLHDKTLRNHVHQLICLGKKATAP